MTALYWNPVSISYFVQLILLMLSTSYFGLRLFQAFKAGRGVRTALIIFILHIAVALYVLSIFLVATLHTDWQILVSAWVAVPGIVWLLASIQFAYAYPSQLVSPRGWEARFVQVASLVLIGLEAGFAVYRHNLLMMGHIEFRPPWMDWPWFAAVFWAMGVFYRQYRKEKALGQKNGAGAARAFLILSIFPALLFSAVLLSSYQIMTAVGREVVVCWIMLVILAGFTLIYLNYAAERTSFMIKIAGICLTVVLGVLSTVAWLIGPIYSSAYQNEQLVRESTALRFSPDGNGGYEVHRTAYRFDEDKGELGPSYANFELPFSFPLFGEPYETFYTHPSGFISLGEQLFLRDVSHRFGGVPGVFPLAVNLNGDDVRTSETQDDGVYVKMLPDRVVVTWYDMRSDYVPDERYTFQLVLYPRGVMEFHYVDLPDRVSSRLFPVFSGPMFLGISPGWTNGEIERFHFQDELPLSTPAGVGVIDDYRFDHLDYLNEIYRPVAFFIFIISIVILTALPLFLRINLVDPLQSLLRGVEKYRNGRFSGPIPVTFRDEIGFLTESFNGLAEKQTELINTLEDQVAERSEAASRLASENARLAERNHLSSELHDAVSQTLFSSSLLADTLPRLIREQPEVVESELDRLRLLNRSALSEMRTLLMELRPGRITEASFGEALSELIGAARSGRSEAVELVIDSDCQLPDAVQVTFYRVAQETLNNIFKHARASQIDVYFDGMASQALLSIRDNGRGFDLQAIPAGHMGLQIMRERVEKIGGHIEIESTPGAGTKLTLIWSDEND